MTINFGNVPIGAVLPVHFGTYNSTGASVTLTGLAITDIEIYKGTTVTQRASDAGYVLIDTDGIDIDGITGAHGFSIDTGDDTDAGFYTDAIGEFFNVWVSAVTIDSQTVNFLAATFRLTVAEEELGIPKVDIATVRGGAISNSSFAAGAIDAAAIAANAIGASELATDAVAEIADQVWDEVLSGHAGAGSTGEKLAALATAAALATVDGIVDNILIDTAEIGAAGAGLTVLATQASVNTIDDFLDTEVAAILADTNELQTDWVNGGRLDLILDARASQASVDTVGTNIDAVLVDTGTDIPASIDALPTAAENAAGLLDAAAGVETGLTFRQWLRIAASALFGKASGLETTTAVYRDFGDTKARITATVDADGNRTAVTTDAT